MCKISLAVFLQCYIDMIGRFVYSDVIELLHNTIMVLVKGGNAVFQVHDAHQPTNTTNPSESPWQRDIDQSEVDRDCSQIYTSYLPNCTTHRQLNISVLNEDLWAVNGQGQFASDL